MDWRRTAAVLLVALLGVAGGCATNPVTGRTQLALISEEQEIALGQEQDGQVIAEYGLYGGPAIQAYVQQLGARLAARTERPRLPWTFRVIDDPAVNAFAIPGGHVYLTRGILTHLTSEAELASVMGHEIGHVTARHGVSQLSKAQLASLGVGVAAILTQSPAVGDLAAQGAQLLFLKFSRSDESQADELGLRYAVASGYDPRPMADVFALLGKVGSQAPGGRLPNWLSSHPAPENRRQRIEQDITRLDRDFGAATVERDSYLRRLDGMVFGDDPRQGFLRGSRFVHPDLEMEMSFPKGWTVRNERQAVVAVSPEQDAAITLAQAAEVTPDAAARSFFERQGISAGDPWRTAINGLPTSGHGFSAESEGQAYAGLVAFVAHQGKTFRLLGFTSRDGWGKRAAAIEDSMASFQPLRDRALLAVQPFKVSLVELPRAMAVEEFALAYPSTVPVETLALINQVEVGQRLAAGALLKRVTGGVPPE